MKKILITLIALVAVIPMWAQSYSKDLEKAAKKGDVEAMYQLGMALLNGDGINKDTKKASEWFKKAMEKGSDEAADAFYSFESKERDKLYKKFDIAPGMEFEGYLSYGGPFVIRINTSEKDSIVGKVHSYDKTTGTLKAEGKVGFNLVAYKSPGSEACLTKLSPEEIDFIKKQLPQVNEQLLQVNESLSQFSRKYIVEGNFTLTTTYSKYGDNYNNLVEFGKICSKGQEAYVKTSMLYSEPCEVTSFLEHPDINRHPNDNTLKGTKSTCLGVNIVYTQRSEIGESKMNWDMGGYIPSFIPWGNGNFTVANSDFNKALYDYLRPQLDELDAMIKKHMIEQSVKTIDCNMFPPSYTDADIQKYVEDTYSDFSAFSKLYGYSGRDNGRGGNMVLFKEEMLDSIIPTVDEYVNDDYIKKLNDIVNAAKCVSQVIEVPMDSLTSDISKYYLPEALHTNPKLYFFEKFDNDPTDLFVSHIILNNGGYFAESNEGVIYHDSLTQVNFAYDYNNKRNPKSITINKKFNDGTTFKLNCSSFSDVEKIKYTNNDSLVVLSYSYIRLPLEEIIKLVNCNNKQDYDNLYKVKLADAADVKEVSKKIVKSYESAPKRSGGYGQKIIDIFNYRNDIEVLFNGKKYYNLHGVLLTEEQLRVTVDNAYDQYKKFTSAQLTQKYQKDCAKYGKKYVDAFNNNTLIKGMPLSMLIDLSNLSHIATWDNRYSCYYICNAIGGIIYKAWFTDGKLTDWVKY